MLTTPRKRDTRTFREHDETNTRAKPEAPQSTIVFTQIREDAQTQASRLTKKGCVSRRSRPRNHARPRVHTNATQEAKAQTRQQTHGHTLTTNTPTAATSRSTLTADTERSRAT